MNIKIVVIAVCILGNIFGEQAAESQFGELIDGNNRHYSQDKMSKVAENTSGTLNRHKRAMALSSSVSTNMVGNRGRSVLSSSPLQRSASMPNLGATSVLNRPTSVLNRPTSVLNRPASILRPSPYQFSSRPASILSQSPYQRSSRPASILSQNSYQGSYRPTSMLSASQGATRPNSVLTQGSLPSLTPSQSASQTGRYENAANKATNILRPFEAGSNILASLSGVGSNIFGMYQSSILTQASIKAQEEQARANALFSNVNKMNFEEKKAGIRIEAHRFQTEIDKLKKEVKQLEDLNANASEDQKRYNETVLVQKREEIRLKEEELNIYNSILTSDVQ